MPSLHLARGKEERETSSRFMEGPIPEPKQTIVYPLVINQYFKENEFVVREVRERLGNFARERVLHDERNI